MKALFLVLALMICAPLVAEEDDASPDSCTLVRNADQEAKDNQDKENGKDDDDKDKDEEIQPIPAGNLALRPSQQPGPLVGFGENILEKGQIQYFLFADDYRTRRGYFVDVIPSVLYGISDTLSVFLNLPIAASFKNGNQRSAGLEDAFIQFEYAFFNDQSCFWTEQATVVFNFTLPTGSWKKNPPTGLGSPSFFIGLTYNHTGVDWFYFGSLGALLTTFHGNNKNADQFLYEMGIGRCVPSPCGWIFAWMVELDGVYASTNLVDGVPDPNTGGNVVYLTPSLWASSNNVILQLGAGGVLTQNLFGTQPHFSYQMVFNYGWTF